MSTPTPITDDAFDAFDRRGCGSAYIRQRMGGLKTELTTALARVAELERDLQHQQVVCEGLERANEWQANQLSESQAQLAASAERMNQLCALLDIECAEATPEDRIRELQAQLTSAREDSARLGVIEEALKNAEWGKTVLTVNGYMIMNFDEGFHVAKDGVSDPIIDECDLRSAIDSAHGHLAETPAGGETGQAPTNLFRKRPVTIKAIQYHDWMRVEGKLPDGVTIGPFEGRDVPFIRTLEGDMIVRDGDWIITGIKGERYPCKPDIFAVTYEPLPPPPQGKETRE